MGSRRVCLADLHRLPHAPPLTLLHLPPRVQYSVMLSTLHVPQVTHIPSSNPTRERHRVRPPWLLPRYVLGFHVAAPKRHRPATSGALQCRAAPPFA
ncbi:hypothetical protein B0H12DRAFT_1143244, partial [Mycena haematopus]